MANPVLVTNCTYIYFTCDRDPTGTEPIVSAVGIPSNWLFYWWNTITNDVFSCQNGSATPLVWWKHITSLNLASSVSSTLGWKINSSRSYSSVSLAFATARTPSATNDTLVIASLQANVALLQTSTMNVQIDSGSGFTTISTLTFTGVVSTKTDTVSFIVPANAQYKLLSSGTATNTITSIFELSL